MVRKRLIVSLLLRNGLVVQSVNFQHTNIVGDPKVAIEFFNAWNADEIILLNVTRDDQSTAAFHQVLEHVAQHCFLPLTAGGWVRSLDDANRLLRHGADKIVVNTGAAQRPQLVTELARRFGSQCIVASIDVRQIDGEYQVFIDRGRVPLGSGPEEHASRLAAAGAGEIMLTSIDRDGSLRGYDLNLLAAVSEAVDIPVISFGGVGTWQHLVDGLEAGADAVAAGNIFHFTEQSTRAAKNFLRDAGMLVR